MACLDRDRDAGGSGIPAGSVKRAIMRCVTKKLARTVTYCHFDVARIRAREGTFGLDILI